jgi:ABC-type sugar transport system ATPase subunit
MEQEETALLHIRAVEKRFPGVVALRGVHLDVRCGEVHGLVGKNGAGKSTLMNIIVGLLSPDAGQMTFGGQPLVDMTPAKAWNLGIAMVPQQSCLVGPLTAAENIFCGNLPTGRRGSVDWNKVYAGASEMLLDLDQSHIDPRARAEDLTVGEQKIISIAKALFAGARLIILDEPTAALSHTEVSKLFSLVCDLKRRGVSFVYISHYLGEVFEICDKVTVLRNGTVVADRPTRSLTEEELARLMVGRDVALAQRSDVTLGKSVLTVEALTKAGSFCDVSFELRRGEILGIAGLSGSGKSQLAECLFGLSRPDSGAVYRNGRRLRLRGPFDAFREGIAYLPEDRLKHGLVHGQSVKHNIVLPILRNLLDRFGFLNNKQEEAIARNAVDQLEIVTPSLDQAVEHLSGGNQQKVVVGKLLATSPEVLVLGEPARGIDVEAKAEVYRIVDELSKDGLGVIVVSDEITELLNISDRILVMFEGRVVREFLRTEAKPDDVLMATEGVDLND